MPQSGPMNDANDISRGMDIDRRTRPVVPFDLDPVNIVDVDLTGDALDPAILRRPIRSAKVSGHIQC